jgi:hypothetical protein
MVDFKKEELIVGEYYSLSVSNSKTYLKVVYSGNGCVRAKKPGGALIILSPLPFYYDPETRGEFYKNKTKGI